MLLELRAPKPKTIPVGQSKLTQIHGNVDQAQWQSKLRSARGRPIETIKLGTGSHRVAILGSLHGTEVQSVTLIDELVQKLSADGDLLSGVTVLVIRNPNPDGLAANSAFNSNGVDLNRNFPSSNWQVLPNNRAGNRGGSEAETRAVMQALEDFRPHLLVHVKDTKGKALVNSEGDADEKADAIVERFQWRAARELGKATTGSVEHYAKTRLKCDSLTLLASRETTAAAAWDKYGDVLLITLQEHTPAGLEATTSALNDRNNTPSTLTGRTVDVQDDEEREPPRRPVTQTGPVPSTGYVELAPSP